MRTEKITAIILAGGVGRRMRAKVPKQFLKLSGEPIIIRAIGHFEKSPLISDVIVVCHKGYTGKLKRLIKTAGIKKVSKVVEGGKTRQESSFLGIKSCAEDTRYVLIHDAVRPFISSKIISSTLNAAKKTGASCPVIDTEDTIVVQKNNFIESVPDRQRLKRVQTPQGFCYKTIYDAHAWARENSIKNTTDDCSLIITKGAQVRLVKGSILNIKITTQADLPNEQNKNQ
ncbi:MAG: 2-C-methyl-D-erythritol 4-phosphate cytidylyltransferase [Candidatus Omnitrophota bacterium]